MRLTWDQIVALADFLDGDDCIVTGPEKGVMGTERRSRIMATSLPANERVRIYDDGSMERVQEAA